jgi:hypothetical protein
MWWILLLLALGWSACATDHPSTTDSSAAEPPATDTLLVAHEWTTQAVRRDDSLAGNVLLDSVTITEQPDFDRMVFTFREASLPGYAIERDSPPLEECGSGKPVELAGTAALYVQLVGAQAHTEAGASPLMDRALHVNQPAIREAVVICDFEGRVGWGVGLNRSAPYRVLRDTITGQIAIDVRH